MKQFVIVLLLSLLMPIAAVSQNTYPSITSDSLVIITPEQLKTANLIFNEHEMLTEKVKLLDSQISNLTEINKLYEVQDSIRVKELDLYKGAYYDSLDKYTKLNKKYKTTKVLSISGLAAILLGVLIWR